MQHRQEKLNLLLVFTALLLSFSQIDAVADPLSLGAVLQKWPSPDAPPQKNQPKKKKKKEVIPPLPSEYITYFQAKPMVDAPSAAKIDLANLESLETKILTSKMTSETKTLDRELEEYFYALELKRAEKYAKKKDWKRADQSFTRALNGLTPFKWVSYWTENTSKVLLSVCKRNKKQKDDICLSLAKRVVDAFPKDAEETSVLQDLPSAESTPGAEMSGDRLTQTYSEKVDKDELAFEAVLDHYLNGLESDLLKDGQTFITDFPKSSLRFRAMFLMAETEIKRGHQKEAQVLYQQVIDQVPLSFYALVAGERIGKPLKDMVKKVPLVVDEDVLNLNPVEQQSFDRAEALFKNKHYDEVAFELDSLNRARNYNTDTLLYLMAFANQSNQNLVGFRLVNELIQRRYDGLLSSDLIDLVFPDRFLKEIEPQATLSKLDPLWVESLMKQESGFRAPIISGSGAIGLMQLMPFTALEVNKDVVFAKLREPQPNIEVGTKYLASLFDKYNGNPVYALAAYNAGPHRVAKWRKDAKPTWGMIEFIESIPFKETRDYVMSILRNRYWYQYRKGIPTQKVLDVGFTP